LNLDNHFEERLMALINIDASALSLSENSPYSVVEVEFNYSETTVQNGTVIYYGATLSDGTNSEEILFSLTVTSGEEIPASSVFAYAPDVVFESEITASNGRVYYTE
jgi:hypothetical protein